MTMLFHGVEDSAIYLTSYNHHKIIAVSLEMRRLPLTGFAFLLRGSVDQRHRPHPCEFICLMRMRRTRSGLSAVPLAVGFGPAQAPSGPLSLGLWLISFQSRP